MKTPEGHSWGFNSRVRGRRAHIIDWEASADYGVGLLAACGMEVHNSYWTDDNWVLQELNPPVNPAKPCPDCVKKVRSGDD